jgi:hypothetical protein
MDLVPVVEADMPKITGPAYRQTRHYDLDDPADLVTMVQYGLIWKTQYAQMGVDAVRSGKVALADCRNMPDNIRALLEDGESDRRGEPMLAALADDPPAALREPMPVPGSVTGWECPTHKVEFVVTLTSRLGRVYGSCTKCDQFESKVVPGPSLGESSLPRP